MDNRRFDGKENNQANGPDVSLTDVFQFMKDMAKIDKQFGEETPAGKETRVWMMLLNEYKSIFQQIENLKTSVERVATKADLLIGSESNSQLDIVHKQCLSALSRKLSNMQQTVSKARFRRKHGQSGVRRPKSATDVKNTLSSSAREEEITSSLKVNVLSRGGAHEPGPKEDDPEAVKSTVYKTPNKPKLNIHSRSLRNVVTTTPPLGLSSRSDAKLPELTSFSTGGKATRLGKKRSSARNKRMNYFDFILSLLRINFIDQEQSARLKKYVIRREEAVLVAFEKYDRDKDLQVLIKSIGPFIDD